MSRLTHNTNYIYYLRKYSLNTIKFYIFITYFIFNLQLASRSNQYQSNLNVKVTQEYNSVQAFFKLTRKLNLRIENRRNLPIMEEEVLHYNYPRENYYPDSDLTCAICNMENMERNLALQMQKEFEIKKLAKNFFTILDNSKSYRLCLRHRSSYHDDIKCSFCYKNWMSRNFGVKKIENGEPKVDMNRYFFIPPGENPAEYMALNFDWVEYLKNMKMPDQRMPYTQFFKMDSNDN